LPVALLLPALQLLQPMPGVITQGVHPEHPAIDIACATGTPVRAAHDGQARVERSYTHGITLVLNGADGLITSYSHLESARPGGTYSRGDVIGTCGNTGAWSSGPHLHFESNRPELLGNLERQAPTPLIPGSVVNAIGGSPEALRLRR
jgi:murein DD-endopeptidase MepM/ murein hydrolase activator NlpD